MTIEKHIAIIEICEDAGFDYRYNDQCVRIIDNGFAYPVHNVNEAEALFAKLDKKP